MKWFCDLPIAVKLVSGFLFVAVIAACMGAFGVVNLLTLGDAGVQLYENTTSPLIVLGDLQGDFLRIRINIRDVRTAESPEQRKRFIDNITKYQDEVSREMAVYEKNLETEEEKREFARLKTGVQEYAVVLNKMESAFLNNQMDEGVALLKGDGARVGAQVDESVDKLYDIKKTLAKNGSDNNAGLARRTTLVMVVAIAFAVFLAVGLGLLISGNISKGIKQIVKAAEKMAKGDLQIDVQVAGRDEIGQLTQSFNTIVGALRSLIADTNMLAQAAIEGELDARADGGKHHGDYRRLVEGINRTLDAVIAPIRESSTVLEEMAQGSLKARVTGDYKGDHAKIKHAMNNTLDILEGYIAEISQVLGNMAAYNLNVTVSKEYKGDFVQLKNALNQIVQSLNKVFAEINQSAEQVESGSRQVSDGSQALSQGATEQAASIEELNVSVSQVASQTKENAVNANQANELALNVKGRAEQGTMKMEEMLQSMAEINESSTNISKIIKVIEEIAFQTNILALNAAVEAARAGKHGKGFAVVAEEVRNLASRSANAAKETTLLIEGSMKKVETGTEIANETAQSLGEVVKGIADAAELVGQIATSSNEQATAISQINQGIEQVSMVVQTNSATAEESAAASEELSSLANMLKTMVERFQLQTTGQLIETGEKQQVAREMRKNYRKQNGEQEDKMRKIVLKEDEYAVN